MTRRYFHADLPTSGGPVTISDAEGQHAVRVMRVQVGDRIVLFNGKGIQADAEVVSIRRFECCCHCELPQTISRESATQLQLGIALPKGDRAKELIERLTELGVTSVTPLIAERSQRPPSDAMIDKLRRAVVEASKQCGRNQLLQVNSPAAVTEFLGKNHDTATSYAIAHPEGVSHQTVRERLRPSGCVLIGPEGGWCDAELTLAEEQGYERISLGRRILRIETAATMIAALVAD